MVRWALSISLTAALLLSTVSCTLSPEVPPSPTAVPTVEGPGATSVAAPPATSEPSPTLTATPTSTPSPTATLTPTSTPTSTVTPTPTVTSTPTVTLTPTVAAREFRQSDGLYSISYPVDWFVGSQSGATVFSDKAGVAADGAISGDAAALIVFTQTGDPPENLDTTLSFWLQMLQMGPWGKLQADPSQEDLVGGEAARGAFVRGAIGDPASPIKGYVVVCHRGQMGVVLGAVAPESKWDTYWPILRRIIDSYRFLR
jgi:hypothetical protein